MKQQEVNNTVKIVLNVSTGKDKYSKWPDSFCMLQMLPTAFVKSRTTSYLVFYVKFSPNLSPSTAH